MIEKYQKIICIGIFFTIILCIGFFCLSTSSVLADDGPSIPAPTAPSQSATGAGAGADSELAKFLKSAYDTGVSLGFLAVLISLAIAGVMFLLSPAMPSMREQAMDRIYGAISGLLILLLTYLIVTTINPQLAVFKFGTESLPPVNLQAPTETRTPGVYLYNEDNGGECSDTGAAPNTSSIADLGELKNRINSVEVVQDDNSKYVTILYENTDFWGKCQYISGGCKSVDPFAESASIYGFNDDPNGDGVYFYRKSYFDDSGGFLKIGNGDIGGIYTESLANLKFEKVPVNEQNCTKYDDNGNCTNREIPTLAGENISSIKIKGSYLVLLVYKGPKDNKDGPWTSCQEFPAVNDISRAGPQQIKWEHIRNKGGVIPNYIAIIPI